LDLLMRQLQFTLGVSESVPAAIPRTRRQHRQASHPGAVRLRTPRSPARRPGWSPAPGQPGNRSPAAGSPSTSRSPTDTPAASCANSTPRSRVARRRDRRPASTGRGSVPPHQWHCDRFASEQQVIENGGTTDRFETRAGAAAACTARVKRGY